MRRMHRRSRRLLGVRMRSRRRRLVRRMLEAGLFAGMSGAFLVSTAILLYVAKRHLQWDIADGVDMIDDALTARLLR